MLTLLFDDYLPEGLLPSHLMQSVGVIQRFAAIPVTGFLVHQAI